VAGEETEKAHHLSDLTLPGKLFVFDDMDPLKIVHRIGSLFGDAAISTFSKIPLVRKAQFMVLYHHLLIGGL